MVDATIWTSVGLGVLQALTEFLPVSSSGHLVLAHEWLGSVGAEDLAFDALLHFATATAIAVYFWRDILDYIKAAFRMPKTFLQKSSLDNHQQMVVALIAGTVPAVILGLLLEDIMATLFRNPLLVAGTLLAGSLIMVAGEKFARVWAASFAVHGWKRGVVIGLFQSLALIPGMSRSGMTIAGGMLTGLSRGEAARFGFLLGTPLLLGAGAKKALDIGLVHITSDMIIGIVVTFVLALAVIHFLLKFLKNHSLYVFVWYRIIIAVAIIVVFSI